MRRLVSGRWLRVVRGRDVLQKTARSRAVISSRLSWQVPPAKVTLIQGWKARFLGLRTLATVSQRGIQPRDASAEGENRKAAACVLWLAERIFRSLQKNVTPLSNGISGDLEPSDQNCLDRRREIAVTEQATTRLAGPAAVADTVIGKTLASTIRNIGAVSETANQRIDSGILSPGAKTQL
jgi:hypothetical protein